MLLFMAVPFMLLAGTRRAVRATTASQDLRGWQDARDPVLPPVDPAEVEALRDRLGHDVRTLDPGDDHVARQALADAAERHAMTTSLLERARSDAQLRTAWLAAVEGLTAARVARARLGLHEGPPIPSPPATGPRLTGPTRVEVDGRSSTGGPDYEPGRPYWFPGGQQGGRYVPGGWYDAPFWPGSLVLGGFGGLALGGLLGGAVLDGDGDGWDAGWGGGFDGGFDGGFEGGGDW
jgi:hypothetical protein